MTDKYFIAKKKALKKGSLNKNCTNSAKFHKSGTLCCRFRKTSSQIFCAALSMQCTDGAGARISVRRRFHYGWNFQLVSNKYDFSF